MRKADQLDAEKNHPPGRHTPSLAKFMNKECLRST
jgi:hypothetical protein